MLAHQFSVSKPPVRPSAKPAVGKKQLMRDTIDGAMQFAFSNLGEWCLVGTFPAKQYASRKVAYARAHYYHERLSTTIAEKLAFHADAYPVIWDIAWNKSKKQYEVRVLTDYRPSFAYNEADVSPWVEQVQYDAFAERVGRQIAESNDAAQYEMTGVERKQVNALKQAMDSMFFGGQ